ncbi:unnamed protein product [Peniophora sp. CBMAI 1063]|nr:unnamed protein product [Peniophora sp. CBMAI 1063]
MDGNIRIWYAEGRASEPLLYDEVREAAGDVDEPFARFLISRCMRLGHQPLPIELQYLSGGPHLGQWLLRCKYNHPADAFGEGELNEPVSTALSYSERSRLEEYRESLHLTRDRPVTPRKPGRNTSIKSTRKPSDKVTSTRKPRRKKSCPVVKMLLGDCPASPSASAWRTARLQDHRNASTPTKARRPSSSASLQRSSSPILISSDEDGYGLPPSSPPSSRFSRNSSPGPSALPPRSSSPINISSDEGEDHEFESSGRIFIWLFRENNTDPELIVLPRFKGVPYVEMAHYWIQWQQREMKFTDDVRVLKVRRAPEHDEWEQCKLGSLAVRQGTTDLVLSLARVKSWNKSLENAREHAYDGKITF